MTTRQERIDYLYKLLDEAVGQITVCQEKVRACASLKNAQEQMVTLLKESVRSLHEMMRRTVEAKLDDQGIDYAERLLQMSITASNITIARLLELELDEARSLARRSGQLN